MTYGWLPRERLLTSWNRRVNISALFCITWRVMTRTELLTCSRNNTCTGRLVQHAVLTGISAILCVGTNFDVFVMFICMCVCSFFVSFCVRGRQGLIVAEYARFG